MSTYRSRTFRRIFLLVSGSSSMAESHRLELSNANVGPMFGLAYNKRRTYLVYLMYLGNPWMFVYVFGCVCSRVLAVRQLGSLPTNPLICLRKYFFHSMSFHIKQMSPLSYYDRPSSNGICKKVMPFFLQVSHEMICLRAGRKIRIFIASNIAVCRNTFS